MLLWISPYGPVAEHLLVGRTLPAFSAISEKVKETAERTLFISVMRLFHGWPACRVALVRSIAPRPIKCAPIKPNALLVQIKESLTFTLQI